MVIVADSGDHMHTEIVQTEETIVGWKATLRKKKIKLRKNRLQQFSNEALKSPCCSASNYCGHTSAKCV